MAEKLGRAPKKPAQTVTLRRAKPEKTEKTETYDALRAEQREQCVIPAIDDLERVKLREKAEQLLAEQAQRRADDDAFAHHQRQQARAAEHKARLLRQSQEDAAKELASRELASRSLLHFVCRMVPGYLPGWVHEDICRRLEKFLDDIHNKRSPRLLLAMPPRHGKSQIASVCFPAWALAQRPYMELITCSYNQSLAEKFSRQAKWCMDDPDYEAIFPEAKRDPKNDSIDNWGMLGDRGGYVAAGVGGGVTGKGAHCFPAGTKVLTERGEMDISTLVQLVDKPRVWSYNHSKSQMELRCVQAVSIRESTNIVEVQTREGRSIRSTGCHPFYTEEHDYRQAVDLADGDTLYVLPPEGAGLDAVPGMLPGTARGTSSADMQPLRADVLPPAVRGRESATTRADGQLLQQDVQSGAPRREERQALSDLRGARDEQRGDTEREVLLRGVQTDASAAAAEYLPGVPRSVHAENVDADLLLSGVREPAAQPETARGGERELSGRARVPRAVRQDAAADTAAGPEQLRGMRPPRGAAGAPLQRGQAGQPAGEPDHAVQDVPRAAPQVGRDAVSTVTRAGAEPVTVYDIQVEGNHNFFADGILVHNCLIIDDPIKDAEQAASDTVKEGIWDWYGSTAYTRLAPGGGVLIIQTLWADDDLAGRVRQQMKDDAEADQFEIVLYPALATEFEYYNPFTYETYNSPRELTTAECDERALVLRRRPGDALHRDRYDEKALARIKKTLHPRYWSALYQQNPVPEDGAFFKKEWFRYAPLPSLDLRSHWTTTIAWDFAITEKQESDYTVGTVAYQDYEGAMWPVEQVRFRSEDSDEIVAAMINLLVKHYRPGVALRMGVEDGQIWKTMQASFWRELRRRQLAHLAGMVETMNPTTDKKVRATPLQGLMKLGMVYWPEPRQPWQEVVEHEFLRFPNGAHDDCGTYETLVDCPAGQRMLGALRDGDEVLTYDGHDVLVGRVHHHHCTGTKLVLGVELDSGATLELSEAHPVLTQRGYVYAGDLTTTDYVIRRQPCVSNATATSGPAKPTATTSPRLLSTVSAAGFINTPTLERLARSRRGGTSTTRTATRTTTTTETSNACPLARTLVSMLVSELLPAVLRHSLRTSRTSETAPLPPSAGSTSAPASSAPLPCAGASAQPAAKPSGCIPRAATTLRTALSRASSALTTKVQQLTGAPPSHAPTAASHSCPAPAASGTSASAPPAATTSTATPRSASCGGAKPAATPCICPPVTPPATASAAALTAPAPTSTSVSPAGARLYPASRMVAFTALERALTTPEDLYVTRRTTSDTSRQYAKVVSIHEIGYRATYNFEVAGTKNYLVHGGHVVHNCIDGWGWNARLQTLHEPPRRPNKREARKDSLDAKIKKHLAASRGRSRSHMAA